jgi:ribosomal protein S18 acetylase RimI-like enzyme
MTLVLLRPVNVHNFGEVALANAFWKDSREVNRTSSERDFKFGEGWTYYGQRARSLFVMNAGEIVGEVSYNDASAVADLTVPPRIAHVGFIYVKPDSRGKGLGKATVVALENHLVEDEGYGIAYLESARRNKVARRMYAQLGWVLYDQTPNQYEWMKYLAKGQRLMESRVA